MAPPPGGVVASARRLRFRCEACDAMILVDAAELAAAPTQLPVPPPPPLPFDVPFGAVYKPSPNDPSIPTPTPPAALPRPLPPESAEAEQTDDDNSLLIKNEGKVYQAEDLSTVQRWIVERRVMREDLISKDGQRWEPVGHRGELEPFFSVMERLDMYESRDSESFIATPPLPDRTPMGNHFVGGSASMAPEDGLIPLDVDDPSDLFGELPDDEDSLPRFDTDQAPAAIFVPPTERETPFDSAELMQDVPEAPAPSEEAETVFGDAPEDEAETVRHRDVSEEAETLKGEALGVTLDAPLEDAPAAPEAEEEDPSSAAEESAEPASEGGEQEERFFDRGGEPIAADLPRWEEPEASDSAWVWVFGALVVAAVLALIFWPPGEEAVEAPTTTIGAGQPAEVGAPAEPKPAEPEPAAPEPEESPEVDPDAEPSEPEVAPEPAEPEVTPEPEPPAPVVTRPAQPAAQPAPQPSPEPDPFEGMDTDKMINAGWDALASGDFSLAEAMFREAAKTSPSDPRAHYGRGYIAMKRDNEALAKREICRALSLGLSGQDAFEAKVFVQRWGGCE